MQQLYSVFLPVHLKPQVKSTEHENGVSHVIIFGIQHCCDGLYQKVKRQKTLNQSVVYHGDSCTYKSMEAEEEMEESSQWNNETGRIYGCEWPLPNRYSFENSLLHSIAETATLTIS
jgi:hypothetical protein